MYTHDKNDIVERLKTIYNRLCKNKHTMKDLIKSIVKREWELAEDEIIFSMGVKTQNNFYFAISEENWEKISVDSSIEDIFANNLVNNRDDNFVQYCRSLGKWTTINKEEREIFYFLSMPMCEGINNIYFEAINKAYYGWIQMKIDYAMRMTEFSTEYEQKALYGELARRQVVEYFHEYMSENYDIDLNIITELAGSYYEGQSCRSDFVFQFLDTSSNVNGVEFDDFIEVSTENIRRIRKMLQMGQKGQYLSVKWDVGRKNWIVTGLCGGDYCPQASITFKITGHMMWDMEYNGQKVVCYKCGKYFIDCENFGLEKFRSIYRNVFVKEIPVKVEKIFAKATQQSHGTVLIIWDAEESAIKEIERLKKESTAIKLKENNLSEEFIESVTSIDGALCIDSEGKCYGIGVILDGKVKFKGNEARGARYNSTRRYIEQCQNDGLVCLAAIISEDRTIDIVSTKSMREDEKNCE